MSELDVINGFLKRTDHNPTEQVIKVQLLELDAALKSNAQEREKLVNALKEKEVEFIKLTGAFDTHLKLVVTLAKSASSDPFATVTAANQ
jgi:hypothetical protein